MDDNTFSPGPTPNTIKTADGKIITVPDGWTFLPPGDAGLTRRVKAAGDHWVVQEKVGRRMFSRGLWTASATIDRIQAELEAERSTEGYAKKQEAAARRREKAQAEYVEDFHGAVLEFLAFIVLFESLEILTRFGGIVKRRRECFGQLFKYWFQEFFLLFILFGVLCYTFQQVSDL